MMRLLAAPAQQHRYFQRKKTESAFSRKIFNHSFIVMTASYVGRAIRRPACSRTSYNNEETTFDFVP
jgi:hypothetical protein